MKKSSLFLIVMFFSMVLFGYAKANFFTYIRNSIETNPGKLAASYIALNVGLTMIANGKSFIDKYKQASKTLFTGTDGTQDERNNISITICATNYILLSMTIYSVHHNFFAKKQQTKSFFDFRI